MIKIQQYSGNRVMSLSKQETLVNFLYKSLEQYGDPKADIDKAINYALGRLYTDTRTGGLVLVAEHEGEIAGAVVINETGMGGYIPENILVYIATDPNLRGKGIGKQLMHKALECSQGDVALHVEADNPARRLYESLGFTNKYLEMRYKKTD